jgi:hypothetical protein
MRFALSLLAALLLAGCASSNIRPEDMSKLGAAPTTEDIDKIAHGKPLHRLDYLVDGQTYTFEIYEAADTAKYYGLLFQAGKLIAVDIYAANSHSTSPAGCMLFPPRPGMEVEACLRTVDQALQAASVDLNKPVIPDQQTLQYTQQENAGAVAETVTEAVLFAPIAVAGRAGAGSVREGWRWHGARAQQLHLDPRGGLRSAGRQGHLAGTRSPDAVWRWFHTLG